MRRIVAMIFVCAACSNEQAGIEKAKQKAAEAAEAEKREQAGKTSTVMRPPVTGGAKLPCDRVVNLEAFQSALAEAEPLTVKDATPKVGDIAASCELVRGGKPLSEAEQKALAKKTGRLGVLPGDTVCKFKAYCYTIEESEVFERKCGQKPNERGDETMGSFACLQVVATGAFDVHVYKFFDQDTKCLLEVSGGPSNTDNDMIRTCAKVMRDTFGPEQIAVR